MRPVNIEWDTTEMVTMEFTPRKLLYRRLVWTMLAILAAQALITVGVAALLRGPWLVVGHMDIWGPPWLRPILDSAVAGAMGLLTMILVALPMFRRMVRRNTEVMSELLLAIRRIAEGGRPKPLAVRDNGEMGYLITAFNDMASQLIVSRQALIDANIQLEKRVANRTHELEVAAHKLEVMASTDTLTGLANRRAWDLEMERRFSAAIREGRELICLALDLDNFKKVNDSLGHKVGDQVLMAASEAIRTSLRDDDFSARLGGDEFVILLDMDRRDVAESVGRRIQTRFQESCTSIVGQGYKGEPPSVSIGMALRKATSAHTAEELLCFADRALYIAKEAGKGRLQWYVAAAAAA